MATAPVSAQTNPQEASAALQSTIQGFAATPPTATAQDIYNMAVAGATHTYSVPPDSTVSSQQVLTTNPVVGFAEPGGMLTCTVPPSSPNGGAVFISTSGGFFLGPGDVNLGTIGLVPGTSPSFRFTGNSASTNGSFTSNTAASTP